MHIEMDEDSQPIELTAERREIQRSFPRSRIWVAAIAFAAAGAFTWYAYHQATKAGEQGVAPLIKAEDGPSRVKPDEPGGAPEPQDSAVYERLASDQPAAPKAESLLPPPETPVAHPAITAEAKSMAAIAPAAGETTAPIPAPPASAVAKPAEQSRSPAKPVETAAKPSDMSAKSIESNPAEAKPAEEPKPTEAMATESGSTESKAAAAGSYRVQLAALRSQDAADGEWKKLQKTYADLLSSLSVTVVKVDLTGKGTFFRVQAGALTESAAKELCSQLKQRKAECIVVKS
ncbi:MAG: SPOR domain-containing protein [Alphaproteobacteria bacterium]